MTFTAYVGTRYVERDGARVLQFAFQTLALKNNPRNNRVQLVEQGPINWADVPTMSETPKEPL